MISISFLQFEIFFCFIVKSSDSICKFFKYWSALKVLFKGGKDDVVYHLRLVDKLGRVLEQKSVPRKNLEVEMSKYTNGSYLIEVIENESQKRVLFNIIKSTK